MSPPSVPRWYFGRPRLDALLADVLDRRLTTVVAGAGYGKTSLLASWGRRSKTAWLTLDRGDARLSSIVPALLAALQHELPNIAVPVAAEVPGASDAESRGRAEAVAAMLAEAIAAGAQGEVILVLDDLHRVEPDSPGIRLVETIIRQAPVPLHVVIAGRGDPPFPIARLRVRGDVLEVDAGDLAFTSDETTRFVVDQLGQDAAPAAAQLQALTDGWPAALRLAVEAMRTRSKAGGVASVPAVPRADRALFGHLAEEVLLSEPPKIVEFIRLVAPFPRFTVALAEALGVTDALDTITDLARRGLFVQAAGGQGWYALHALVRRFARERFPFPPADLAALHVRAASCFEAAGQITEAAATLAATDQSAAGATGFLRRQGRVLLTAGRAADVVRLADAIAVADRDISLDELAAEAAMIAGDLAAAGRRLEHSTPADAALSSRLASMRGRILWERGELRAARDVYQRAVLDGTDVASEAMVLAYWANTEWVLGDVAAARALATDALERALRCGDATATAAAHNVLALVDLQVAPVTADQHYRAGIAAAEQGNDVFQLVRLLLNHAALQLDRGGSARAAFEMDDRAVRLAELAGWPAAQAAALKERALRRLQLGELDEARVDVDAATRLWEQIGSARTYLGYAALGGIQARTGALASARAHLERALVQAADGNDVQFLIFIRCELARLVTEDDPTRADRLLAAAIDDSHRLEYALGEPLLARGWVALARGDGAAARALAEEATDLAHDRELVTIIPEALELRALSSDDPGERERLLAEAIGLWSATDDVHAALRAALVAGRFSSDPEVRARGRLAERRLREIGVRLDQAARVPGVLNALLGDRPGEVLVQTLGGFSVRRAGRAVMASEWRSRKARDLLKILVARRGRPAARETLMELLWPDEEPDRLPNRLAVALATLRNVLDRERRFASDRFVAGDHEAVWLDGSRLTIDVERFLTDAQAARKLARRGDGAALADLLEAAEGVYAGDFLEEEPFADWAVPLREEARAAYVEVVRELAAKAIADNDPDAAVRYLLRLLERDAWDEDAQLGLVAVLGRAGRHGEARRRYGIYSRMMEEIGAEAAPFPRIMPPAGSGTERLNRIRTASPS